MMAIAVMWSSWQAVCRVDQTSRVPDVLVSNKLINEWRLTPEFITPFLQLSFRVGRIILESSLDTLADDFALIDDLYAWIHQVSDP